MSVLARGWTLFLGEARVSGVFFLHSLLALSPPPSLSLSLSLSRSLSLTLSLRIFPSFLLSFFLSFIHSFFLSLSPSFSGVHRLRLCSGIHSSLYVLLSED